MSSIVMFCFQVFELSETCVVKRQTTVAKLVVASKRPFWRRILVGVDEHENACSALNNANRTLWTHKDVCQTTIRLWLGHNSAVHVNRINRLEHVHVSTQIHINAVFEEKGLQRIEERRRWVVL